MNEVYPEDLSQELEIAQLRFAEGMMKDEVIGEIVRAKHRQDPTLRHDFPDFWMEPTLVTNDNGTHTAGINIMHGRTYQDTQETAKLHIGECLPLATLSQTDECPMTFTPKFRSEAQHIGLKPAGPELGMTMQRWQECWGLFMKAMHGAVEIDPICNTLVLRKVLQELPAYFRDYSLTQTDIPPYDFSRLISQYDWITNVQVPANLEDFAELIKVYTQLQSTYGVRNVRYSLVGARDGSTGRIKRIPGFIGLYTKKGGAPEGPYEIFFSVEPTGEQKRNRRS